MLASGNYSLLFTAAEHFPKTIENVSVSNFQTTILNVELIPNPVPVELVSFTVQANGSNVELYWTTATELNNSGFEIERALINPKSEIENPQWEYVGFVPGFGTTTEPHTYSFIDKQLLSGSYSYRLKQIDYDGSFEYSNIVEVTAQAPKEFSLSQNYPNPFNPITKIHFEIPLLGWDERGGLVTLKVYDVLGNEVATLVSEEKPAGEYEVEFDGSELTSGVYFYKLISGNYVSTKKTLLLK
jgi:hypothetical protein